MEKEQEGGDGDEAEGEAAKGGGRRLARGGEDDGQG
jgi:hypothetical protein